MTEHKVELYVYDLSQGLARQMSMQFLGIQIDAVYHTSIVVFGREYYYGAGIQSSLPERTHHGAPMEIIPLGTTSLPQEVVLEYLDSMKQEYTPESYDLFLHNCNNFTADLTMFLCGVEIPEKIKNLPQEVLNTPFGQMMRPVLESQLRPITQAAPPPEPQPQRMQAPSRVKTVTSITEFDEILNSAPCVVAFFTSSRCPPCTVVYPHFEQLAAEAGEKGVFVKVDIGVAGQLGSKYGISATPTFITWSKGEQLDLWKGASPADLKRNVEMLMAVTYPAHPHTQLSIPTTLSLANTSIRNRVVFSKLPPLEKVASKLGPIAADPAVSSLIDFLRHRASEGAVNAPIPDEPRWSVFLQNSIATLPEDTLFPLVDLLRASLVDPRVSGWFAEEKGHATIKTLLDYVTTHDDAPYSLKLVTTQSLCNLFTSPLFLRHLTTPPLSTLLISVITSFLLEPAHATLRVAAGNLAFLLASHVQQARSTRSEEVLSEEELVELAAAAIEGLKGADESEGRLLALSLAMLLYCAPMEGTKDLAAALGAGEVLDTRRKAAKGENARLFAEVGRLVGV
ncbi:PPPDE putative peptidase domain-containing protein [Tricharina praecox]|uniref:PPPDE putative peptidase domain-containing protein n=1 Tax=Tricharina praecox TaxID=43433 RepID=UPI00221E9061|nr:PPPDE putative peptidase domain-containing protein [Tricharina praecox]KAI5854596.1 PPPDE putative peptidase domain-containing protein [Tricharina praecox]